MTNFEKLKADIQGMTAREYAAKYIAKCDQCAFKNVDCIDKSCVEGHIKWLEREVKE